MNIRGRRCPVDQGPYNVSLSALRHTTDVRRRKLGIYKESGFPEIWVLVPWDSSRRAPGLAIHVRWGDAYREEPSSRAFPGWKAEEIHLALTEAPMSEVAWRALERVALAMGAREGTEPDDNPLMRSHGARTRTKAHAQGHREGLVEGRSEMLAANVLTVLKARGIAVARDTNELRELFGALSGDAALAVALACTDAADFRRRVRERDAPHGGPVRTDD